MTESMYHIWLSLACGAGDTMALKLLNEFETAENIYLASKEDFLERIKFANSGHILERLLNKDMGDTEKIIEYCSRNNVSVLTCDNSLYPKRLKGIRSYPVVLYYKGKLIDIDDNVCITMVGTRKMTNYGKMTAYELGRELASCGAVVVSGMANGIDAASHKGCLFEGGFTVAILGCGIDIVYPPENKLLMDRIIERGLILTEYPPHTEPRGKNFPVRNRIMTGLSQAIVVVEADNRSGALITARLALTEGRDVFAVPGNINVPQSHGTNRLIKDGATLVTGAYDILGEYEHLYSHKINIENSKYYRSGAHRLDKKRLGREKQKLANSSSKVDTAVSSNNSIGNDNVRDIKNVRDAGDIKDITVEISGVGELLKSMERQGDVNHGSISIEEKLEQRNVILSDTEMEVFKFFYNSIDKKEGDKNENKKFHPNDIDVSNMSKADIINTLTFLELYGLIVSYPGDYFALS